MRITTPKLTGPEPAWAPFKGWSVLFDTYQGPDQHDRADESLPALADGVELLELLELLELPDDFILHHELYRHLSAWSFGLAARQQQPGGYLPLPPSSYHVTVCDGLSEAQLGQVKGDARQQIAKMLSALPGAVVAPASLVPSAGEALSWLAECAAAPVDFALTGIETRGHALVAALEPADESRSAYSRIAEARQALLSALGAEFGIDLTTGWRPHVSLGYWVNSDVAEAHERIVVSGSREMSENMAPFAVRLGRASVHAFDDMATYWRARRLPISAIGQT